MAQKIVKVMEKAMLTGNPVIGLNDSGGAEFCFGRGVGELENAKR
jgi:acetyl-CoA carboxylase carboxyltransferase component